MLVLFSAILSRNWFSGPLDPIYTCWARLRSCTVRFWRSMYGCGNVLWMSCHKDRCRSPLTQGGDLCLINNVPLFTISFKWTRVLISASTHCSLFSNLYIFSCNRNRGMKLRVANKWFWISPTPQFYVIYIYIYLNVVILKPIFSENRKITVINRLRLLINRFKYDNEKCIN